MVVHCLFFSVAGDVILKFLKAFLYFAPANFCHVCLLLACVRGQLYQVIRSPWLWLDGHPLGFWIIGVFCRAVLHVCHFHFSIWLPPFLAVSAEIFSVYYLPCNVQPIRK